MSTRADVSCNYVLVGDREVHYRRAGEGPPVVIVHESPLSSLMYESHVERLGARFTALALDTPGYGNSDSLPVATPSIADYADALAQTLDALGIRRCGLYGVHTGACIALELAARRPHLVAGLVLDGLLMLTDEERGDLLERYCPVLDPEIDGSHLVRAWAMRLDMHLFFPWYRRSPEASLPRGLPDARSLHQGMLEYLRAGGGYHRGYHAAFRYEPLEALRELTMPAAIVAAETDGIFEHLVRLPADLPPNVTVRARPVDLDAAVESLATYFGSLDEEGPVPPPRSLPRPDRITRCYATMRYGQLHLRARAGGPGRTLLLVHGSPTSAAMLEPLMTRLARSRPVYAFDTFGNGDSAKPDPVAEPGFRSPAIVAFAEVLVEAIEDVGVDEFDLYGTHTGAAIAIEMSLLEPSRVGRLILDGVAMFDETTVIELLERYFVDLSPRTDGSHLVVAWGCARDSTFWFPWYRRDPAHQYRTDVFDADALHRYVVEFLKSGSSYSLPYSAAFSYRAADRLPLLTVPTLIGVHREDPLVGFLDAALSACPGATGMLLPDDPEATTAVFERFLDEGTVRRA